MITESEFLKLVMYARCEVCNKMEDVVIWSKTSGKVDNVLYAGVHELPVIIVCWKCYQWEQFCNPNLGVPHEAKEIVDEPLVVELM